MQWHLVPAELRNMILGTVVEAGDNLATAAAVSREWQHALEPHTFAHIRLPVSRVPQLNIMTQRNRSLIRCIWFCIELEQYDCKKCSNVLPSSIHTSSTDNEHILEAFQLLFSVLSTWEPNKTKLTLDISIYSKSDTEHAHKYITVEPDIPGRATQHGVDQQALAIIERQNEKHQWETIEEGLRLPSYGSLGPLFAEIWLPGDEERVCWEQAPKVRTVTRLVMRLQTRRRLQPNTVKQIISHLDGLLELHYEFWRCPYDEMQEWLDADFVNLITTIEGLENVTIFEHTNKRFLAHYLEGSSPERIQSFRLGQQFARICRNIQYLSASFMIDAENFFSITSSEWCNLTNIALTSRYLLHAANPTAITKLLEAAASAARRMPKLKTMEVWNGSKGVAALFKYDSLSSRRSSVLTWRATWRLTLEDEVVEAWSEVAGDRVNVVHEYIVPEEITCSADAVVSLKLSEMIIRPVSLQQILREEKFIDSMAAQVTEPDPQREGSA